MDRGPLLRTVASLMLPFLAVLALYLLLNGHNRAGGGFIAGVLMSGALAMQFMAHGYESVPRFLRLPYRGFMAVGIGVSIVVGTIALVKGYPFLTSFHSSVLVPVLDIEMEFALAQAFDAGIFLLVVGGMMTAMLALREG
ncbi:MAG: hypothetical protein FJ320_11835 [SAR202 cluster bacterium]|nr:hypothetical protein [SAR202 cluster bacterium]